MIKGKNFNSLQISPRVLVTPLDWGLGHATRCIPVILALVEHGCEVIIAADGAIKELLQKEFPKLEFIDNKGYKMRYSRRKAWFKVKLFLQFPKLLIRIRAEKRWLKQVVEEYKIDAVVSDNRLGMSFSSIPSIYITHQLLIKTGNSYTDRLAQKIHYHFINKYSTCWVPDWDGNINLAGELSHPAKLPDIPVVYIGPLSRFEKSPEQIKYDCCFILSGPEPQRCILENVFLKEIRDFNSKAIIVRGLPQQTALPEMSNPLIEIKNHLPAAEMSRLMLQSKIIISRCGYSTIMDLVKLQKKAVLIPTPGQTEQEYLGEYLGNKNLFVTVSQNDFYLKNILKKVDDFSFSELKPVPSQLDNTIKDFVTGIFKVNNTNT